MNILHISTSDLRGGAALAAYRLHRAMLDRPGIRSCMLVRDKLTHDTAVIKASTSSGFAQRVKRWSERRQVRRDLAPYTEALSRVELFSDDRGPWRDGIVPTVQGFDVIQLHWVCQFLNYRCFFQEVPDRVPLLWRLADKNPFTGGCHYDSGCGRFEDACGRCPMLGSRDEHDLSRAIWSRKKSALDRLASDRLHIVALNQWMARQVRRSSLLGRFDCSVIPNGVDVEEFRPIDPEVARAALGIPGGRRVVAFVAEGVANVRKGFRLLLEALGTLKEQHHLFLLIVGEAHSLPPVSVPSLSVGYVQAVPFLRQVYSAAHVFVIPSLEDNQPNTVLESMACGTPVVGFKADGIPEMVEEGQTGLLAPRGEVAELARAIAFLLEHEQERSAMAACSRRRAQELFSRRDQVRKYLDLYTRLRAELPVRTAQGELR